jgi:hypothetical protein
VTKATPRSSAAHLGSSPHPTEEFDDPPARSRLLAGLATAATVGMLATGIGAPAATAAPQSRQDVARDHARAALAAHPAAFRTGADDTYTARGNAVLDPDGAAHVRYERTYRGLAVLGGDVVVHLAPDGTYDGSSLGLQRPLSLDPAAEVSRADAVAAATRSFDGTVSSTDARRVVDAVVTRPYPAWEVTLSAPGPATASTRGRCPSPPRAAPAPTS